VPPPVIAFLTANFDRRWQGSHGPGDAGQGGFATAR
jgi:hypothetical protein